MGTFRKQVALLLWKNWIIEKRHKTSSIVEICIPICLSIIVALIGANTSKEITKVKTFKSKHFSELQIKHDDGIILRYAPENVATDFVMVEVMNEIESSFGLDVNLLGYENEDDLVSAYRKSEAIGNKYTIAIVFDADYEDSVLPQNLKFKIRPVHENYWKTDLTYKFFQSSLNQQMDKLFPLEYFKDTEIMTYQDLISKAVLSYWRETYPKASGNETEKDLFAKEQRQFPDPPHRKKAMIVFDLAPSMIISSFLFIVVITTKRLVEEKEKRIKEAMKLVGLSPTAHWFSWFLTIEIKMLIAVLSLLAGFCGNFSKDSAFIENSSSFIVFIILLLFSTALISFCFMASTFVKTGTAAAFLSGILYCSFELPIYYFKYEKTSKAQKIGLCFIMVPALQYFSKILAIYEELEEGVQFSNLYEPPLPDDNFTVFEVIIMLIAVSCLYILIGWYVDKVFPGDYGIPHHPCFFVTKSYWSPSSGRNEAIQKVKVDPKFFEAEPTGLTAGIQIKSLTKRFGDFLAVSGSSMNMYKGQISVLLGHNGAGKTTTMSMITGFINPTSGTALINGFDIRENLKNARKSLGLCPQYNILFDELTVEEHLLFFGQLKGMELMEAQDYTRTIIIDLGLAPKAKWRSLFLSGGQKRKLSVGIALIGHSEVLIFDEPTASMDPSSRRETWAVLQKYKEDRTIMLTTHFMDEADVLGDRIAVMSRGAIHCCGSPMFLKNIYGTGYHMVVVKMDNCDILKLTSYIKFNVATASLEKVVNSEVTYLLPSSTKRNFSKLFKTLDNNMDYLKITGYGIYATTMEEVFLNVNNIVSQKDIEMSAKTPHTMTKDESKSMAPSVVTITEGTSVDVTQNNATLSISGYNEIYQKKGGCGLLLSQLYGLLVKKVINSYRGRLFTLSQILVPTLPLIWIMFASSQLSSEEDKSPQARDYPALWFDLEKFNKPVVIFSKGTAEAQEATTFIEYYKDQFGGKYEVKEVEATEEQSFQDYLVGLAKKMKKQKYKETYIIGAEVFEVDEGYTFQEPSIGIRSYHSGYAYHAEPIALNYVYSAFLKFYTNPGYSMQCGIHPLPNLEKEEFKNLEMVLFFAFYIGTFLGIHVTFFARMLVMERGNGAKHLQRVSGMSLIVYWLSNFLWDFIIYALVSITIVVTLVISDAEPFASKVGLFIQMFLLYGIAVLPFVYLVQFLFKSPGTATACITVLNFFTGIVTLLLFQAFKVQEFETAEKGVKLLTWILPTANLMLAIMEANTNYQNLDLCKTKEVQSLCKINKKYLCCEGCTGSDCKHFEENYLSWSEPGIGKLMFALFLQGVLYFFIVLLIDLSVFKKFWYASSTDYSYYKKRKDEDDDVAAERERINTQPLSTLKDGTDSLLLVNLSKRFKGHVAVDSLCVGIPAKECFGLLGVNGAGKTTTFKMLTGDVLVSEGNAYLNGFDIKSNIRKVQSQLGYCPQYDGLIETMTGREILTLFARIRGIPSEHIRPIAKSLMQLLSFEEYADKKCGIYSGGNKRKLSVAVALIGDSPFLMFDEPSAGMDPQAKRHVWNVLSQIRDSGRTLVLTSHSMDECDALCTRIAIMVGGQFMCLGSPQHLKNKFGKGYTLTVKVPPSKDPLVNANAAIIKSLEEKFKSIMVLSECIGYIDFQISDASIKLSEIFATMESMKDYSKVEDYTVVQTTLEQVFLGFAN